ncbi:transcriptional regulator [Dyadobacter sp. CY323]|uniref:transcriptional regulator n=1 Tax=Dyadobacter sp. CY323 TaxID=2907302 RepID=UPI001F18D2D7|nr:transcriptional regulator [Dyadobacter sp. CY323]MCE6987742.1 transcriptional regulator [Dyadobacter sp. CY323]
METTVYEDRAKELIAEIRQIIEVKGIDLNNALSEAGISPETADLIFNNGQLPTLSEFLMLCEISGITFHLPSVETPNTPM